MANEVLEDIYKQIDQQELSYNDLKSLNQDRKATDNLILYMNIRGLKTNFEKLQILNKRLKIKPYVIVCAESGNLEHYQYFTLSGYNIYYNHSHINKSDGVVVYVKKDVKQTTTVIEMGKLKILNTIINLKNNSNLQVSSMYRSHGLHDTEFILKVNQYLQQKRNVKNHLIIGDFNIDIKIQNTISQNFLNNFLENGFYPGFTDTTRPYNITTESGTCIDNIFIKTTTINTSTFKLLTLITDHYPLFIDIKKPLFNIDTEKKKSNYSLNYKKLAIIASQTYWTEYKQIDDPNEAINLVIDGITQCQEKSKRNRVKDNYPPRKEWITSALLKSCKEKDKLYKQLKRNPANDRLQSEYKNYVKCLNKVIKDAKIKYEKDTIEKNSYNPRQLWKIINSKLGNKGKKDNNISEIYDEDKEVVKDPTKIANIMNDYYGKMGKEMSDKITATRNNIIQLPPSNLNSIFLNPTNENEIKKIIANLKPKNGGVDKINAKTLKSISDHIADTLAHIMNKCIEKSIWPDALKAAEVVPIYKSGKKLIVNNYRPISLISNIAKIFEKVIYKRIFDFIHKHKILSEKQYGFIKNKGTRDALGYITKRIYENLDKSKPIAVAFLDLAKAFDTVDHNILLHKLHAYGIRGNAYKLMQSYLTNRKQKVRIDQSESEPITITVGVPQGTILGPLLFILYINDLLITMPENSILSYADDTAVITSCKTWKEVEREMNQHLEKVAIWLALNKLTLNISKTVYITFGNYCDSVPKNIDIYINKEKLKRVDSCKYLGVNFDYNLKWDEHINHLIKKTRYLNFIFYKINKFMQTSTLKVIYYAFFHSVINYGIIAWGGVYKNNQYLLQNIQNRLLKLVFKNTFEQNIPMNIRQLFTWDCLKYYYNEMKDIFTNSNSKTRNKAVLLPKMDKRVSEKNNYITAIKTFNLLPNELKTLEIDKRASIYKLKKWVIKNF